jgi:hypothetical protein
VVLGQVLVLVEVQELVLEALELGLVLLEQVVLVLVLLVD